MDLYRSTVLLLFVLIVHFGFAQIKTASESGYTYQYIEDDPLDTRIYTLKNGLKVYLTVNKEEPRIQSFIAVKAGSKNDPRDNTGLAHYLEHMLFKGTDEIGTLNWEKEKQYLDKISDLYEKHKALEDPAEKEAVYQKIDSLSQIAAQYTAPNEYDKLLSAIGAQTTNAFTSKEQTVYMNNIPSNELERWLKVESERFQHLTLRLFHTELETVYEEYNMRKQDNDDYKVWDAIYKALFDRHTYYQSTIGQSKHLKNPSMEAIHDYFNTYYVPNNVAICLSGDLDPNETIKLIDEYFGDWEKQEVPEFTYEKEPPITEPIEKEVYGPKAAEVNVAFRLNGAQSEDMKYIKLINKLLYNRTAGLMDINLVQKQKVLGASAFVRDMKDYGLHIFSGKPREGQTLEEVKDLMFQELEKIKKGTFDKWLMDAVINNMRLDRTKQFASNFRRAFSYVDVFVLETGWESYLKEIDEMAEITKEELVAFANEHYKNNYVVVYKREGEDTSQVSVEKPDITPLELNRDTVSDFFKKVQEMEVERLAPVFIDYEEDIQIRTLSNGIKLRYVENKINNTFKLYYYFEMGRDHDKKMALAVNYLPYLGTSKYTAEELKEEFFKKALDFNVSSSDDRLWVSLSGLESSFQEGVKLFEHILSEVQPDEEALEEKIKGILKKRADAKKNKRQILWRGLFSYARYGKVSPNTHILSEEELKATNPKELVKRIKKITNYKHRIYYYGQNTPLKVKEVLDKYHKTPDKLLDYPQPITYSHPPTKEDSVFFTHHEMVQAEILLVSKGQQYNKELEPMSDLFNQYFGSGLSSVVFQEIRESKGLAYSAFANYSTPEEKDEPHYIYAYVGTQADKMQQAFPAMRNLMNDMPLAKEQFNSARESVMKKIESNRITGTSIFWNYERARRLDLDYDIRKDIYSSMQNADMQDLKNFFEQHIKDRHYKIMILGSKEHVDMDFIRELGPFKELSLETIFGY